MKTMALPFTRTDYDRLPEGFPAQLIAGQLVREAAPTYGHNRICARIRFALSTLLGPDRVPDSPSDVAVDDHNVFQPDIVVLASPVEDDTSYVGVPLVAVEVFSPTTREVDRGIKAERLLEVGVSEVWLVEPATQTIEIRTASTRRFVRGDEVASSDALPAFRIVTAELFTPAR